MTTATEVGIPDEWKAAIDADPADLVWRWSLADWFDDRGYETAAECMRWAAAKGVQPFMSPAVGGSAIYWAGQVSGETPRQSLPCVLLGLVIYITIQRGSYHDAFDRLVRAWQRGSDEQRRGWWNWKSQEGK